MRDTEVPATILESDKRIRVQVNLHRDVAWIAHAYFSLLLRASGFRSHYCFLVLHGLPNRDPMLLGQALKAVNHLVRWPHSSSLP